MSKSPHDVRPLTPKEFEQYVATLVRGLSFATTGAVYTNKRYKGIRQPGLYEVDVALEVQLAIALKFTLIVECKNWRRPVDRPIVQKLAQTRDAISADKAAIASPTGFTKEAAEVARNLEVALWVVTLREWIVEYDNGAVGLSFKALRSDQQRDWVRDPAKVRLMAWDDSAYGGLKALLASLDLPHHLRWLRYFDCGRWRGNAREEVAKALLKALGIEESQWYLGPHRAPGIGNSEDGILVDA